MEYPALERYREQMHFAVVLYMDVYPYRIAGRGIILFLLLKRRGDVRLPGNWQAVSGKIRKGEGIRETFFRQTRAKTGREALMQGGFC